MILSASNLLYYLLERGLVSAESVVDGDYLVVESSSRNRNFKVQRQRASGYFVKQVQQAEPQAITLLQREATAYWLAQNRPDFAPLRAVTPTFHGYDPAHHVLIVDLLDAGENLSEHHRRLGAFPIDVAARLGQTLAHYHGVQPTETHFPKTVPWILSAHQMAQTPLSSNGNANDQVLAIIRQFGDFHGVLDRLRTQWRTDTFIHGDMKWENCLIAGQNGQTTFKVIDWETADIGDAAWDVGAIFQAYLTFWIMSVPLDAQTPFAAAVERAQYPIEAMQPAIRAFWHAYGDARRLNARRRQELALRSVQYGATRMLQTAYEYMYYSPHITGHGLALLQLGLNTLTEPAATLTDLLGIDS
jgi:hypothetical protein